MSLHCRLSRGVPVSLCAWTAEAPHLCLDVSRQVYCAYVSPLCECGRIDWHARVLRSCRNTRAFQSVWSYQTVCSNVWTNCLIELSWLSPSDQWAWPLPEPSTRVVRRLRRTVGIVRSWPADAALSMRPVVRGPRGASLSPLSGRRQPFYDAVVGELGAAAVVAAWTHQSPSVVPRRRRRWTWCRRPRMSRGCIDVEAESTTALTPGSIANRSAPAAAVVCCCRPCCRVCVV